MDDDYDFQQTKRDYNRRVTFAIIGVLAAAGLIVVRFALRRERESYSTPVYVAPSPTTTPPSALPIARDPIEFELAVGADNYDVVPDKIVDVKGTHLTFEQNPTWVTAGAGYHVKHRNTVSVSPTPDMVIASVDGVVAKIETLDAKLADAEARTLLSSLLTSTGQTIGEPTSVKRTIAGKPRDGVRHDTTTAMQVEVYLVHVGKQKLGVYLYIQDKAADLTNITALLASIAEGPGEQLPEFTAKLDANTIPVFLDQPATLGALTFTLRRRPTILRTMIGNGGSLTFEHPRGVAVSRMPNDQMLVVSLQNDRTAIQLFDLQMRFAVDELKTALMGQVSATDLGEVTHGTGTNTIRGRKLRIANMPVDHELFVFDRAGKTIGATIQYAAADEKAAIATALPVLLSVR